MNAKGSNSAFPTGVLPALALVLSPPAFLTTMPLMAEQPAAVCLATPVMSGAASQSLTIIVPATSVAAFTARGFVVKPCGEAINHIPQYREEMCWMANSAPADIRQNFETTYAISSGELCELSGAIG